jgi:RHS repeat-associated protein
LPIKIGGLGFVVGKNHKGNIERSETQYRFNGEVLKMRLDHEGILEVYDYETDHMGRKTSFKHTLNGILKNVSKYQFDDLGRLKTKQLSPNNTIGSVASGSWNNTNTWQNNALPSINDYIRINTGHIVTINYGEAGSAGSLYNAGTLNTYGSLRLGVLPPSSGSAGDLQTVDYSYHIRGGLRGVNLDASGNLTNKLFSMKLGYEDAGFWDGNIGKQEWKSNLDNVTRSFTYDYDGASRIKSGIFASTKASENYSLNNVNYDFNGNITNLSRNGWKSNNTFGLVDNLNYTYNANSNKILKVEDASNETASFRDVAGNDYTYSLDGSLTSDNNKGISVIEYNYLKLPRRIVQNGVTTLYQYASNGAKLREIIVSDTTDYLGNVIKKNSILYQISHDEGRVINGEYEYNIKDHLGNLRLAFRDSSGIAKITQANSYGVWGEDLPTLSYFKQSWKVDNFRQTGKELLQGNGYTDFGARLYDNLVPRFITIDKFSPLYSNVSTYGYCLSNPIKFVDIGGNFVIDAETARKYPALAFLVNNVLPNLANNPEVLQALAFTSIRDATIINWGGGKKQDIINFIKSQISGGSGPNIRVTHPANSVANGGPEVNESTSGHYAGNDIPSETNNIYLNRIAVERLENAAKSFFRSNGESGGGKFALEMFNVSHTITHELAHFLLYALFGKGGEDSRGGLYEAGDEFSGIAFKGNTFHAESSAIQEKAGTSQFYNQYRNSNLMRGMTGGNRLLSDFLQAFSNQNSSFGSSSETTKKKSESTPIGGAH